MVRRTRTRTRTGRPGPGHGPWYLRVYSFERTTIERVPPRTLFMTAKMAESEEKTDQDQTVLFSRLKELNDSLPER